MLVSASPETAGRRIPHPRYEDRENAGCGERVLAPAWWVQRGRLAGSQEGATTMSTADTQHRHTAARRRTERRRRHRRIAAVVTPAVFAALVLGACDGARSGDEPNAAPPKVATNPVDRAQQHDGRRAVLVLAALPIQGRAPMTGYSREQFGPAWTDDNNDPLGHNGCDTRNDILRRDLSAEKLDPGHRWLPRRVRTPAGPLYLANHPLPPWRDDIAGRSDRPRRRAR